MPRPTPIIACGLAAVALLATPPTARGQTAPALNPGDVVRIDREFVGTLMSIDDGVIAVLGEGKPSCTASVYHGEGPRCDPAPVIRRTVGWDEATIELQLEDVPYMRRTILGGVLGAVALAPVGYLTGPSLGYGKVPACAEVSAAQCTVPLDREEVESRQRAQDQRRGTLAFAILGASIGAVVAKATVDEWVQVTGPGSGPIGDAWSVGARLPVQGR